MSLLTCVIFLLHLRVPSPLSTKSEVVVDAEVQCYAEPRPPVEGSLAQLVTALSSLMDRFGSMEANLVKKVENVSDIA